MKQPFPNLLKLLGLKREKPKTKLGKILRHVEYNGSALGVIYILLQLFPQVAFANAVQAHGITLYSSEPIDACVKEILADIDLTISTSTLYREDQQFSVFICNKKWLYTLFSPINPASFGISNPLTQNIFIADADIINNKSGRFAQDYNDRALSSVIVHEMGHSLMRRQFGLLKDRMLPNWLKEGYCEMLAGESSFPLEEGDVLLAEGGTNDSKSFKYFTWRRMVEYLFQVENCTIEQLVADIPDKKLVIQKTRDWIAARL